MRNIKRQEKMMEDGKNVTNSEKDFNRERDVNRVNASHKLKMMCAP
jgi:hypothetical protein